MSSKGNRNEVYFMAVTADEYEHPIAIARNGSELDRKLGLAACTASKLSMNKASGKRLGMKFVRVEIPKEE